MTCEDAILKIRARDLSDRYFMLSRKECMDIMNDIQNDAFDVGVFAGTQKRKEEVENAKTS